MFGTGENSELLVAGSKKAWIFLGRLRFDTSEDTVKEFVKNSFPDTEVTVEKLESKGTNASFRLSVDFDKKEEFMNSAM